METGILEDIKRMLGIESSTTEFDVDVQSCVNSAFFTLNQLGVGPENPFSCDEDSEWVDFTTSVPYDVVRDYIFMKTRLVFDPPSSSFVTESIKDRISELEFRMNIQCDDGGGNAHL